jgi:Sec-independent protein translocase protein TatA
MATLENINEQLMKQNDVQERTAVDIKQLKNAMFSFIDFSKQSRLDDLEAQREAKDPTAAMVIKNDSSSAAGGGFGLAGFLGAAAALLTAFGAGLVESVKEWIKLVRGVFSGFLARVLKAFKGLGRLIGLDIIVDDLAKAFKSLIDPILDFFRTTKASTSTRLDKALKSIDTFLEPINKFFKNFKVGFGKVNTKAVGMFDDLLKMEDFTTFAAKLGAGVRGFTNLLLGPLATTESTKDFKTIGSTISDMITKVVQPIKNFFSAEGPIGRFMSSIKSVFGFAEEGSKVMKLLGSLGKVAGRLFYPLGIFMTIWDTISGAFKGFVDEKGNLGSKVLAGIEGGISGFLKGLVGIPLDLLKKGVSWIAGKLGFKDIEKAMDDFSFEKLIGDAVNSIFGLFRSAIDGVIELVASGVEKIPGIGDGVAESIRALKLGQGTDTNNAESDAMGSYQPKTEDTRVTAKQRQRMLLDQAVKMGVYNERGVLASEIDREKVKDAPRDQLQAILADKDLSRSDKNFVKGVLEKKEKGSLELAKRQPITGSTIEQGAKAVMAPAPAYITGNVDQSNRSVTSVSPQAITMQSGPPVDFSDPMLLAH